MPKTLRLSRRQLYRRLWSKPRSSVAEDLGVSFTALGRLCDRLMIPYPSRDYWTKSPEARMPSPGLPAASGDVPKFALINGAGARRSRRALTRLPREDRRSQIIDKAAAIVRRDGLKGVSIKELAKALRVSEALIYNHFSSVPEVLAEVAKRELKVVHETSQAALHHTDSHLGGSFMMTTMHLKLAAQRGALLDTLLTDRQVRRLAQEESRLVRNYMIEVRSASAMKTYGAPFKIAHAQMHIMFGMTVRAGRLVGAGDIDVARAERMCLAVQLGAMEERFRTYAARGWSDSSASVEDDRPAG